MQGQIVFAEGESNSMSVNLGVLATLSWKDSSVREQVRWPEKPARRVSSRTHGPHVLPTPLDASAATTTYFLINASYGQGQFRSGVVR